MHRRSFIKISGSLTALSTLPWFSSCTSDPDEVLRTPQVLGTFCSHDDLATIGKSYCELYPEECNPSSLEKLLLTNEGKPFSKTDSSDLEEFLSQKINDEFRTGELAIVNGWVLSRTEARQVALYSLLS